MHRIRILGLVVLTSLLAVAAPRGALGDDEAPPTELDFFKGYYIQHAERRPQEALLLYLAFLEKAPDSPYAMNAARLAYDLLQGEENAAHRAAFLEAYGDLLPAEAPSPPAHVEPEVPEAQAVPAVSRDVTLLEQYEAALAAGRSIPDVRWAQAMREHVSRLWNDGEFMDATRVASQIYRILAIERVAGMLQRKQAEVDTLRRRVEIDTDLADTPASPELVSQIEDTEKALANARTEVGLADQIARLYPESLTAPGPFGLLPLTLGIAVPDDPRFTTWLRRKKLWLADQARRPTASEQEVQQALDLGRILTNIDQLLHDGEWTRASAVARELWLEYSRRD